MVFGRVRLAVATVLYLKRHALVGVGRTLRSYRTLVPVALEYRSGVKRRRSPAAMEAMHERNAPRVLRMIHELRGLYTKIGQVMSIRTDQLPGPYVESLATLQDGLPPRPFGAVSRQIRRELGRNRTARLRLDAVPLGVASIGQTHRGTFDGERVCVKIQDARVRRQFKSDMGACRAFCSLVSPGWTTMLDEVRRQFDTEFDYGNEAANLDAVRENMKRRGERRVVVPRSLRDLTTERVLGMEYLEGPTLLAYARDRAAAIDAGAPLLRPPRYLLLRRELARYYGVLVDVHAKQLLVDGCFNGDPHPGNILRCPDGRLGLIDYGQVKRISDDQRRALATLIVALADDDERGAVDAFVSAGFRTKRMDPECIFKYATLWFNRDDRAVTGGVEPMKYYDLLNEADPTVSVPDQLILASRMTWLLRCFGQAVGIPKIRLARDFRAAAVAALDELPGLPS